MNKTIIASIIAGSMAFGAQAQLIQHTDQIAEVQFTGSTYELGKHVGEVANDQIHAAIKRFDNTLNVMLPGLSVKKLEATFDKAHVYENLKKESPDSAAYIQGLSESMQLSPNYLLAVGMSDEAILESQRSGGMGFLQAEKAGHDPKAPAKCTVMGQSDGKGKAWGAANFDYMGVNYEGLIVLKHTDDKGQTKVVQTWAGLIPYGGVSVGGQPLLMNTMADEGTARQIAEGEILAKGSVPSYHLSWDAYNAHNVSELKAMYHHQDYTAFFSYMMLDPYGKVTSFENKYGGDIYEKTSTKAAHANHSVFGTYDFVDAAFSAHTLDRQAAAEKFVNHADINTTEKQAMEELHAKPLWKGRGELMGTVSSTYFSVNGKKVDMVIYTDSDHKPVRITNY